VRVALVHDWLTGMRGGEKVLLSLARLFPHAPIYTLLHIRGSVAPELEARDIRTSFAQNLPGVARRYRWYLPLFPRAIESFDFSAYDLVLSSSHCVAKGAIPGPRTLHVSYCFTPMRYVWDRYDDYFGPGRMPAPLRLAIKPMAARLRRWDARTSSRVHRFVADSAYVAERIQRYYGREADVIHAPVDADFYTPGADRPGTYDLVVSALAPYKRVDLVLEAYRGSGRPLKIVGSGPERERLQAGAPPEAEFLGYVDDARLRELYRGCRVVIMPGVEDFGIVPLEAMACGRPAIVYGEGGGLETVLDGVTGLVFREPTAASLRAAVDSLGSVRFDTLALRERAQGFSRTVFEERLNVFLDKALAQPRSSR
jgi:glycosyltransferase involved in cell wall biosynthesis